MSRSTHFRLPLPKHRMGFRSPLFVSATRRTHVRNTYTHRVGSLVAKDGVDLCRSSNDVGRVDLGDVLGGGDDDVRETLDGSWDGDLVVDEVEELRSEAVEDGCSEWFTLGVVFGCVKGEGNGLAGVGGKDGGTANGQRRKGLDGKSGVGRWALGDDLCGESVDHVEGEGSVVWATES